MQDSTRSKHKGLWTMKGLLMNFDDNEANFSNGEDSALNALQASDPALGLGEPDLVAIREKVDTGHTSAVSIHSSHVSRPARFPRWSYAAAAAVVAMGVGTGTGYSIAAKGSESSVASPQIYADCVSPTQPCNDVLTKAEALKTFGSASSLESKTMSSSSTVSRYGWSGGSWLTPAESLSDTPSDGHAYIMSSDGLDRGDAVRNLIEAFNFGPHKIKHNSAQDETTVTENDSQAAISLAPSDNNLAPWWYDNQDNGQYACEESSPLSPKMRTTDSKSKKCSIKTGTALTHSEATAVAKEIFSKAGLDMNNVTWEAHSGEQYFGVDENNKPRPYVQVVAHMTVEDQDTTLEWTIELAPDGSIVHASGILAKPTQVPDYETVGAQTAVLRSQDKKWSDFQGPQLIPNADGTISFEGDTPGMLGGASKVSLDSEGRPALEIQLDQVTITSAEPSLYGFWLNNTLAVLPVYKLTGGGRTWIQLSVADKYLLVK